MEGRRVDDVEGDRPLRIEADRPPPAKRQAVRCADAGDERVGGVRLEGLRRKAAEAEDNRPVGSARAR
jgi:hypothetical protein